MGGQAAQLFTGGGSSSTAATAPPANSSTLAAGNAIVTDFEPSSDPNAPRIALNGPRSVEIAQLGSYDRCAMSVAPAARSRPAP